MVTSAPFMAYISYYRPPIRNSGSSSCDQECMNIVIIVVVLGAALIAMIATWYHCYYKRKRKAEVQIADEAISTHNPESESSQFMIHHDSMRSTLSKDIITLNAK